MRSLVPIACNQFATLLMGIVGLKLISEFVEPDLNGVYALFVTLTQIGGLITHSGVINHATRYWQRESAQPGTYARFLWSATWSGMKYLAPLLALVSVVVSVKEKEWNWIWVFPFLLLSNLAVALNHIATGALNADRRPWEVFLLSFVGNAARTLVPIGLGLAAGMTFLNLGAGFTLHGGLVVGCLVLLFRRAIESPLAPEETRTKWFQELKDYGRPFLWLGIGNWLLQFADRWVVEHFFGVQQAGFFAYASSIGAIVPTLVVGGLMQWFFPTIFRRADQAQSLHDWQALARTCDKITVAFVTLTLGGLLVVNLIAPHLIDLHVISAKYGPALPVLIPAGLAMVTVQVNQFYYLLLQGQHNSAGMVRVMMVVSGLKTVGSILAAWFSWTAFLWWLMGSLVLSAWLGRWMIRSMALRKDGNGCQNSRPSAS